jgi:hypothetical protein
MTSAFAEMSLVRRTQVLRNSKLSGRVSARDWNLEFRRGMLGRNPAMDRPSIQCDIQRGVRYGYQRNETR